MTCPGCGAQDDQGCRRGCPEVEAQREAALRRCERCGCHHPRIRILKGDEFGGYSVWPVQQVYRDGHTLTIMI